MGVYSSYHGNKVSSYYTVRECAPPPTRPNSLTTLLPFSQHLDSNLLKYWLNLWTLPPAKQHLDSLSINRLLDRNICTAWNFRYAVRTSMSSCKNLDRWEPPFKFLQSERMFSKYCKPQVGMNFNVLLLAFHFNGNVTSFTSTGILCTTHDSYLDMVPRRW